jgi:hypothetical protein
VKYEFTHARVMKYYVLLKQTLMTPTRVLIFSTNDYGVCMTVTDMVAIPSYDSLCFEECISNYFKIINGDKQYISILF